MKMLASSGYCVEKRCVVCGRMGVRAGTQKTCGREECLKELERRRMLRQEKKRKEKHCSLINGN